MSNSVDISNPRSSTVTNTKLSYADMSRTKDNAKVIIKPKNSKQSVNKTKGDIINSVDPVNADVKVKSVKSISSGGVILTCCTKEAEKLKSLACDKLSDNYEIRKLTNIKPQIRIVGIPAYMDQTAAIHSLHRQNDTIFKGNTCDYKCLKFWGTKYNKDILQCIIEVDLDIVACTDIIAVHRVEICE